MNLIPLMVILGFAVGLGLGYPIINWVLDHSNKPKLEKVE